MPALRGESKDQLVLNPADAAHDGDDAVVDLEVVAEEGHHHKPLQTDVETLTSRKVQPLPATHSLTDIEALVVGVLRHAPAELPLGVEQAVHVVGAPHLREKTEANHRQYDRSLSVLFITEKLKLCSTINSYFVTEKFG